MLLGNINFAAIAGFFFIYFLFIIGLYIYLAICLRTIARKTNTPDDWMAWVPIANILLIIALAKKPYWWFVLFLLPIVNIVIMVMLWMAIAENRGKENWWGILMILPIINFIAMGYLAFSNGSSTSNATGGTVKT